MSLGGVKSLAAERKVVVARSAMRPAASISRGAAVRSALLCVAAWSARAVLTSPLHHGVEAVVSPTAAACAASVPRRPLPLRSSFLRPPHAV